MLISNKKQPLRGNVKYMAQLQKCMVKWELGEFNIHRQVSALFEYYDIHIYRQLFAIIRPDMGDFAQTAKGV